MAVTTYKAEDVAGFFIDLASREYVDEGVSEGITNLKLQKILYYAQAAHLAVYDKPLFDEDIVAWPYGPVVVEVYDKYKGSTNRPLPSPETSPDFPEDLRKFLESVWDIYGKFSAYELVEMTHAQKPWKETFLGSEESPDGQKIIGKDLMKEYYKGIYVKEEA